MKIYTIGLVCPDEKTRFHITNFLQIVFRGWLNVEGVSLQHVDNIGRINAKIVLFSAPELVDQAKELGVINRDTEVIIAKRMVHHHSFEQLLELYKIKDGTNIYVSNINYEAELSSIELLKSLKLNHLNYIPYHQANKAKDSEVHICVTFGNPNAPTDVARILDLGPRQIEYSTIVEIAQRLGISDYNIHAANNSAYIKSIMRSSDLGNFDELIERSKYLNAILGYSRDGILLLDKDFKIICLNEEAATIIASQQNYDIYGKELSKLIPTMEVILSENNTQKNIQWKNIRINGKVYACSIEHWRGRNDEYLLIIHRKKEEIQLDENNDKGFYSRYEFSDIITQNQNMKELKEFASAVAKGNYNIVIYGETGTGKELFAHSIHNASLRRGRPFIFTNVTALPDSLIESELFGYEEGAFTGAKKGGKPGLFELANGGTIFLDEIGDLSLSLQTKLLRVIQERRVQRVGGTRVISLDVRIIAATNRNLLEMCAEGTFRKDLYYRLHVVPIHIPPLRERKDDIPLLMNYFLRDNGIDITLLTPRLLNYLHEYEWAGNTRELENFCQYITSLVDVFGEEPGKIEHKGFDFLQERQESFKRLLPQPNNLGILYQQNQDYDQDFINILQILNQAANNGETMSRNKVYESLKSHHPLSLQQTRDRLQKMANKGLVVSGKTKQGTHITEKGKDYLFGRK